MSVHYGHMTELFNSYTVTSWEGQCDRNHCTTMSYLLQLRAVLFVLFEVYLVAEHEISMSTLHSET